MFVLIIWPLNQMWILPPYLLILPKHFVCDYFVFSLLDCSPVSQICLHVKVKHVYRCPIRIICSLTKKRSRLTGLWHQSAITLASVTENYNFLHAQYEIIPVISRKFSTFFIVPIIAGEKLLNYLLTICRTEDWSFAIVLSI